MINTLYSRMKKALMEPDGITRSEAESLLSEIEDLIDSAQKARPGARGGVDAELQRLAEYEATRAPLGPSDFYESQEIASVQQFCRVGGCRLSPEKSSWYCKDHRRRF